MKKSTALALTLTTALALGACSKKETPKPQQAPPPIPQVEKYIPPVNSDFATSALQQKWQNEVQAQLSDIALAPPAQKFIDIANMYRVTPADIIGPASAWDATKVIREPYDRFEGMTREQFLADAKKAEANGEEFEAGKMYARIGDKAGVQRALNAMKKELEWEAVASLSVDINDKSSMLSALNTLKSGDQISKINNVLAYALQKNPALASEIMTTYNLPVPDEAADVVRKLALNGNGAYLSAVVRKQLDAFKASSGEENMRDMSLDGLVADIAILSRGDRAAAAVLAKEYVSQPWANTIVSYCTGECSYGEPIPGLFDVYNLVASDPAARQAFLDRTAEAVKAIVSGGNYASQEFLTSRLQDPTTAQDAGDLFASYLGMVRKSGSPELMNFWREQLTEIGTINPFKRELGKIVLGDAPDINAPDLGVAERAALQRVMGPVQLETDDVIAGYERATGAFSAAKRGKLDGPTSMRMLLEQDIEPLTPKQKYTPAQYDSAVKAAEALNGSESADVKAQIVVDLLASGYRGEIPPFYTQDLRVTYAMAQAGIDVTRVITPILEEGFKQEQSRVFWGTQKVRDKLYEPIKAADTNAAARNERQDIPHPVDRMDAIRMIEPVIGSVRSGARRAYDLFIVDMESVMDSTLYETELARMVAANDLSGADHLRGLRQLSEDLYRAGSDDPRQEKLRIPSTPSDPFY
jgi:hypothetical protein